MNVAALCRDCLTAFDGAGRCPVLPQPAAPRPPGAARLLPSPISTATPSTPRSRSATIPSLRDRPVIVGGGTRGVVSTACYIARIKGVRSAMPMFKALKLCPEAVVVRPRMARYVEVSPGDPGDDARADPAGRAALARRGLPRPLRHRAAAPRAAGRPARPAAGAASRRELGVTASVGLSHNKFLAKIASELDKPRGFAVIGRAETAGLSRARSRSR